MTGSGEVVLFGFVGHRSMGCFFLRVSIPIQWGPAKHRPEAE